MSLVDELPYTPWRERGSVVDGEFRWRLGVRPLDLDDWIELGPDADGPGGWIAQKERVLADHHRTAFVVRDDVEYESREIAEAVLHHLRHRWPARCADVCLDDVLHPLEAASRLVPEDLVMMVEREGRLIFGGGSVCFPNRWDLRSKLGRTMAEVHAPVAGLNDQLEPAVDRFLERLTPDRSFWRLGWGIIDVADGFTPGDGTGAPRPVEPAAADLFVRVERETLRRFPTTGCVLFTIRTYIAPIASVLRDGESAAAIAGAVAAMPSGIARYKDLVDRRDSIAELLTRP
ncbi:heme-dependent oxidative N-demethylase family protein [Ilumatobacter sp.]|uniref:heme-dependent oxidative N-demethylase family protein n=1 Tax=Ilumatobacter sp. TaxID=1967498 RepID=UPI003C671BA7